MQKNKRGETGKEKGWRRGLSKEGQEGKRGRKKRGKRNEQNVS